MYRLGNGQSLRLAKAGKAAEPKASSGQERGTACGLQRPGKGQSLRLAEARKGAESKACAGWEMGTA